jgi:hypothetical protein
VSSWKYPGHRPGKRNCWLVDVDGTVALKGDRDPYDWSRVRDDTPNENVLRVVRALSAKDDIVYLSGRDEVCRYETMLWLQDYTFARIDGLFMRGAGDKREDSIIKLELLREYVMHTRVVAMWRSIGLTCLQVAPGAF